MEAHFTTVQLVGHFIINEVPLLRWKLNLIDVGERLLTLGICIGNHVISSAIWNK